MALFRAIGLMSGTSMDGIDAALIESDGKLKIKQLATYSLEYHSNFQILLKAAEFVVSNCQGNMNEANLNFSKLSKIFFQKNSIDESNLANYLYQDRFKIIQLIDIINHSTYLHEKIVKEILEKSGFNAKDIDLIGYHGQTFFHSPKICISIQVGNAQYLSNTLGITVIDNFRINDIRNGGQGAPLAPIYHYALTVRDNIFPAIIVNCGGISNITYIPNENELDIIGFDTGPGNILIDRFVKFKTNNAESYDQDGKYGANGKVHQDIIDLLYQKAVHKDGSNYFSLAAPKSLDSSNFELIPEIFKIGFEDACATLEAFTALTIIDSVKKLVPVVPKNWVLAGGGFKNPVITQKINEYLEVISPNIKHASEIGWDGQFMEAELMAYLAIRSFQNLPISFPKTTNVNTAISGGNISLPNDLGKE